MEGDLSPFSVKQIFPLDRRMPFAFVSFFIEPSFIF